MSTFHCVIVKKWARHRSQNNLDRQTRKISALLPGSLNAYKLLAGKDVLQEKGQLGKDAAIERFEHSPFVKEFKKQTSVAEKQYH